MSQSRPSQRPQEPVTTVDQGVIDFSQYAEEGIEFNQDDLRRIDAAGSEAAGGLEFGSMNEALAAAGRRRRARETMAETIAQEYRDKKKKEQEQQSQQSKTLSGVVGPRRRTPGARATILTSPTGLKAPPRTTRRTILSGQ